MDDLRERVTGAIKQVLDKYFDAPERTWPHTTHEAITAVKHELIGRVEAEFERTEDKAAPVAEHLAEAEE